jgi:hypothetical protein
MLYSLIESKPIVDSESRLLTSPEVGARKPPVVEASLTPAQPDPSPPGKIFKSLFPSLNDGGQFRPINCNTSSPIPFKTDIFEGIALLTVNASEDPSVKVDQSTMTFEVQVQGKFTRKPRGILFIGAEISKRMELGLITRGICRTIMQFARSVNPFMHHSFGDKDNNELPHISGPLWSLSDRVVVTKPGGIPPTLGAELPEPEEQRRLRRSDPAYNLEVDVNATYSFSTNTKNIELVEWAAVNIPLLSKLDLHTFWMDADLFLCAYELDMGGDRGSSGGGKNRIESFPELHPLKNINYCFRMELKHASNHPELKHKEAPPAAATTGSRTGLAAPSSSIAQNLKDLAKSGGYEELDLSASSAARLAVGEFVYESDEDGDLVFFDANTGEGDELLQEDSSGDLAARKVSTMSEVTEDVTLLVSEDLTRAVSANYTRVQFDSPAALSPVAPFIFTPVVIELDDVRKLNLATLARRVYYGIQFPRQFSVYGGSASITVGPGMALKSYKECTGSLQHVRYAFKRPTNFARLSESEQRRAELQCLFDTIYRKEIENNKMSAASNRALTKLFEDRRITETLLEPIKDKTMEFGVGNKKLREGIRAIVCHSRALVQLGRFYWSEEYMVMTDKELIFIKPTSNLTRTTRLRIQLDDIIEANLVPFNAPLISLGISSISFLTISTFTKEYNVAVRGHSIRDEWLAAFVAAIDNSNGIRGSGGFSRVMSVRCSGAPTESAASSVGASPAAGRRESVGENSYSLRDMNMLSEPRGFKLGDRVVLNGRRIQARLEDLEERSSGGSFSTRVARGTAKASDATTNSLVELEPTGFRDDRLVVGVSYAAQLVAEALEMIIQICEISSDTSSVPKGRMISRWIEFMDKVSILSNIQLDPVSFNNRDRQAVSLFLNLYHVMLLHSFLAVKVPSSVFNWPSIYNACSYEAFGDIFSLSELEHGVLRAGKING